jgi:osmoprotectant transport system permease protein
VLLMRAELDEAPLAAALASRMDETAMIALNARGELDGVGFAQAAREFLDRAHGGHATASALRGTPADRRGSDARDVGARPDADTAPAGEAPYGRFIRLLFAPDLPRLLAEHLALVAASASWPAWQSTIRRR